MFGKVLRVALLGIAIVQADPLWRRAKRSSSDEEDGVIYERGMETRSVSMDDGDVISRGRINLGASKPLIEAQPRPLASQPSHSPASAGQPASVRFTNQPDAAANIVRPYVRCGRYPQSMTCHSCRKSITTRVEHKPTLETGLCTVLTCCLIWCPCAPCHRFIEINSKQTHYCPQCNEVLGHFKNK